MISITGSGVCALNSVEFASVNQHTFLANEMTAICNHRHNQRYGILFNLQ